MSVRAIAPSHIAPFRNPAGGTPARSGESDRRPLDVFQPAAARGQAAQTNSPWLPPKLPGDPNRGPGATNFNLGDFALAETLGRLAQVGALVSPGWTGAASLAGGVQNANGQEPNYGDRSAYLLTQAGIDVPGSQIGQFKGPNGQYLNGSGQTITQLGNEGTPQEIGAYLSPQANITGPGNSPTSLAALWSTDASGKVTTPLKPGATVTLTMTLNPSEQGQLLGAVKWGSQQTPPVTFVVPSLVYGAGSGAEAKLKELQDAGGIVVGTSLPPQAGAPDGQPRVGMGPPTSEVPMLIVNTWEHSGADSLVGSAVAVLKQAYPNATNAQIQQYLKLGMSTGTGSATMPPVGGAGPHFDVNFMLQHCPGITA